MITSSTNVSDIIFLANQLRKNKYVRTIWIPIVDYPNMWSNENSDWNLKLFDCCYRVDPLEKIAPQFIRFVLKTYFPPFQIGGEPFVISLDNRGRLVHFNAFHMMMTWGSNELDVPSVTDGSDLYLSLLQDMKKMILRAGVNYVIDDIDNKINIFAEDFYRRISNWTRDINSEMSRSVRSYNYTSSKEKALWNAETWSVNLVIYPSRFSKIRGWSEQGECIFLYGGNNIKCVEEFATKIKEISSKIQLEMKLAYVGKSIKVKSVVENISDYVHKSRDSRSFWLRLRSVLVSRINYLNEIGIDERGDNIAKGLKKLLAYEARGTTVGGWALLSEGKEVIVCDLTDKILAVMNKYETWKDNVPKQGFSQAFKDCYNKITSLSPSSKHHNPCCAVEYPLTLGHIPENMECPQCFHNMHRFITFTCCHHLNYYENNFY
ncbi:PREDICTED: protein SIEVE ELEMENT OCCLUSION B-like [Ipomoea nil]|uniref:protein SIEVE ELEMENT OCCLUSION B-like n=1 Tax=Ipomoea nil TaxID=35883 RepID=UPI000900A09F|nr:PREDICTED: protein SIEVE ELEMENT OCCLUSION B-like [Ipomoea nil]